MVIAFANGLLHRDIRQSTHRFTGNPHMSAKCMVNVYTSVRSNSAVKRGNDTSSGRLRIAAATISGKLDTELIKTRVGAAFSNDTVDFKSVLRM